MTAKTSTPGQVFNITNHYASDPRTAESLDGILARLSSIEERLTTMSVTLQDQQAAAQRIEAAVSAVQEVQGSVVALLEQLSANDAQLRTELRNALDNGTDEDVRTVIGRMDASAMNIDAVKQALAAAVVRNTPAENPQPDAGPVPMAAAAPEAQDASQQGMVQVAVSPAQPEAGQQAGGQQQAQGGTVQAPQDGAAQAEQVPLPPGEASDQMSSQGVAAGRQGVAESPFGEQPQAESSTAPAQAFEKTARPRG